MARQTRGYKPPKDVKQWWLHPHCGHGTLDPNEICGFCGRTYGECAAAMTAFVAAHPDYNGWLGEEGPDDLTPYCGGSGFWCGECGRFWPQDVCGECDMGYMVGADGAQQVVKDGKVYCVCGRQFAVLLPPGGAGR